MMMIVALAAGVSIVEYFSGISYLLFVARFNRLDYLQHMTERMLSKGHYKLAKMYVNFARLDKQTVPLFQYLHGLVLYRLKAYHDAKNVFEKAKEIEPFFDEIDNIIGDNYIQLKDYNHAKPYLDHFLLLHPENIYARINLAIAEYRTDHHEASLRMLDQVLDLDENNLLALKLKGSVQMRLKKYEQALSTFQYYQTLGGQDNGVHFNIMRLLKWLERNEERASYAEELLFGGMDNASVYTHYGDALCRTGRFQKGAEMLTVAVRIDEHQAEAHYLLAKLMAVTHHKTEALEHLESAIKDNPSYVIKAKYDEDFNNLRFFRKFYRLTEEVRA
ncbi:MULTISPECIES: tetratricopeptide repeat protein [unclassified Fusibacter]|uniref:tetratricopeptide repeat protein n=1 Tax=unclassified Fusibacter TaxID=2624464 RepID=UPI0010139D97|nr:MULTISPECIES: tetratricopeptide repeat protein [unclassified Fusibacter]MCK8059517.1 hypothetical protein [Fusibacter sp. A2]NPE21019.1 hypothetical protein [Fusibacter sp. A1]RXV62293.1 hypothetical protein DWB64_04230 [Fusibacter sp. A1]